MASPDRKRRTPHGRRPGKLPLSTTAYERMRQAIQSGEYGPGDRILEVEIARKFGVSRTPVREALRRLEDEGILVHESRRGMTVARLDHRMIMELYVMRDILECAAASMAARHASEFEIDLLSDLIQQEGHGPDNAETMAEQNRRFHLTLYQCAHNRFLLKTLSVLGYSLALLSKTAFSTAERRAAVREEHRRIVDAVRARDPERAERAAHAHMHAGQVARMGTLGVLELDPH